MYVLLTQILGRPSYPIEIKSPEDIVGLPSLLSVSSHGHGYHYRGFTPASLSSSFYADAVRHQRSRCQLLFHLASPLTICTTSTDSTPPHLFLKLLTPASTSQRNLFPALFSYRRRSTNRGRRIGRSGGRSDLRGEVPGPGGRGGENYRVGGGFLFPANL